MKSSNTPEQTLQPATMVPITVSLTYINYAVVTVVGALLASETDTQIFKSCVWSLFASQLCPFNQFTQLPNFLLTARYWCRAYFAVMEMAPEVDGQG